MAFTLRTASSDHPKPEGSPLKVILRLPNWLFIILIRFYQLALSPLMVPTCRFTPSCSRYALQAFEKYNVFKALGLSIYRVLRCNPFNPGGYDPLP
jgi:putative membrane protein insertion efficiency factor